MPEAKALLILVAALGVAVIVLAGFGQWFNDPARRLRRGLRKILGCRTHSLIIDPGAGRGVAFNFQSNEVAVAWDTGAWGFRYRIGELEGAEVIVDGKTASSTRPGEKGPVALRLLVSDPHHPDFLVGLCAGDDPQIQAQAVSEAFGWQARIEAMRTAPRHSWWEAPSPVLPAAAAPDAPTLPAFRSLAGQDNGVFGPEPEWVFPTRPDVEADDGNPAGRPTQSRTWAGPDPWDDPEGEGDDPGSLASEAAEGWFFLKGPDAWEASTDAPDKAPAPNSPPETPDSAGGFPRQL